MEERIIETRKIRDLIVKVANGTATDEEGIRVYRMFGDLSPDMLNGLAMGITWMLRQYNLN